ncbi:MAG: CoB--CoM heterodisulfide reductase iron-sulfur subunit A family protein [bacterium]|nr:CoB--CoM heterodisulfide reductase iron-sulfur subunit A family protein [bacterium]
MDGPNRIGVYVCQCGTNISDAVDVEEVVQFARSLDDVEICRDSKFLCAESGQDLIQNDIRSLGLERVVVAACSPLMHETTFREACQAAGLNPFNLQIANIREQVAWVTPDRQQATEKSKRVVDAAVRRVALHESLHIKKMPVAQAVLVVGAGITGIEAALSLAEAGKKVYLVERAPSIGGHMAMLDRTFPTLDCSACILVPKMASAAEHPNITLFTCSEVEEVGGYVGSFRVRVRKDARFVDEDLCNGCGLCVERCPWGDIPSEYDQGMGVRTAVYFPFNQSVPHLPLIDQDNCAHFQSDTCSICANVCPTAAIDFDQQEEHHDLEVGAIILATGYETFDPTRAVQYGYGRWDNIVTSLQFERLCHPSGPTAGRIIMKDGTEPKSIAVLHCIGSRDINFNRHCSRICCMTSLKMALLARQRTGARVFSFYIDMRANSKHGEEFYEQAQRAGVVFIHGKGTEVIHGRDKLLVKAEDTLLGQRVLVPVDMVILGVGLEPRSNAPEIARQFGIGCTQQGFFMERHVKFAPVQTANKGIFIAGACQGPKDIPDSVAQGAAAAAGALGLLDRGVVDTLPTVAAVNPDLCSGCSLCIRDCPYQAIEPAVNEKRDVVEVNDVLCKSCGSCAATCPAGAISQLGFTSEQIHAEIEGLLARAQG